MAPSLRSLGANTRLSMLNKPRALATRAEFAADINREWANALESTVACGRRLNEAKATLPHGAYEAMIATDLPFSTSTARKLREVATFVDTDKVPLDRLPEAMSTLYAIATLPEETRQQALEQGVIRPEVTRAEVEALKPPKPAAPQVESSGLFELFAGSAESPTPLPDQRSPPPAIVGEAVPVSFPPPAAPLESPKANWLLEALHRPWTTMAEDPGAIAVELEDGRKMTLLIVLPHDPTAADVARRVVGLHNTAIYT